MSGAILVRVCGLAVVGWLVLLCHQAQYKRLLQQLANPCAVAWDNGSSGSGISWLLSCTWDRQMQGRARKGECGAEVQGIDTLRLCRTLNERKS